MVICCLFTLRHLQACHLYQLAITWNCPPRSVFTFPTWLGPPSSLTWTCTLASWLLSLLLFLPSSKPFSIEQLPLYTRLFFSWWKPFSGFPSPLQKHPKSLPWFLYNLWGFLYNLALALSSNFISCHFPFSSCMIAVLMSFEFLEHA